MEYFVNIIGNVLEALYRTCGASLVIAVLFMCVYLRVRKHGVGPVVQGWIREFRTDSLFRRQFFLTFYVCMMLFRTLFCRPIWETLWKTCWEYGVFMNRTEVSTQKILKI